jgi:hypothetical protein
MQAAADADDDWEDVEAPPPLREDVEAPPPLREDVEAPPPFREPGLRARATGVVTIGEGGDGDGGEAHAHSPAPPRGNAVIRVFELLTASPLDAVHTPASIRAHQGVDLDGAGPQAEQLRRDLLAAEWVDARTDGDGDGARIVELRWRSPFAGEVTDKWKLRSCLEERPGGVYEMWLRGAYAGVDADLQALKAAGHVWTVRNDGQSPTLFRAEAPEWRQGADVVRRYRGLARGPISDVVLQHALHAANKRSALAHLMPAPSPSTRGPRQRRFTDKGTTNTHLLDLLNARMVDRAPDGGPQA